MPHYYKAGIGSVGSYQVAGVPFITGSGTNLLKASTEHKITFPSIAKSVLVRLNDPSEDHAIRIHFNPTGSGDVYTGNHYVELTTDRDAFTFNVKCKEIYISNNHGTNHSGYVVVAELTGISPSEMFALTGSGLTTIDGT